MLRPLVRLMIRSGVTFPVLADLLRGIYVDVAGSDLLAGEQGRNDSRISLLTGIHRKELRRKRIAGDAAGEPAVVTLNSQLIGRWLGDPTYMDMDGQPLALARAGKEPSFETLVAGGTRDMRPRAVLGEWLVQGIAVLDSDDRVRLDAAAFLPRKDEAARMFYFARNLHDHAAAAAANVVALGEAPFLDRSVHYDGLGLEAAGALEREARAAATRLLLQVNRTALGIADRDRPAAGQAPEGQAPEGDTEAGQADARPTRRVNLGVYLYVEDETPPETRLAT